MKEKLLSGRYFLTVVIGLVFAYASATDILPASDIKLIIGIVITSYFQRNRKEEK